MGCFSIPFLNRFWIAHPEVFRWARGTEEIAQQIGFVTTIYGRRRRIPGVGSRDPGERAHAFRQVINSVVQGTAADINKLALIRLFRGLDADCRLLLTVHDSEAIRKVSLEFP